VGKEDAEDIEDQEERLANAGAGVLCGGELASRAARAFFAIGLANALIRDIVYRIWISNKSHIRT